MLAKCVWSMHSRFMRRKLLLCWKSSYSLITGFSAYIPHVALVNLVKVRLRFPVMNSINRRILKFPLPWNIYELFWKRMGSGSTSQLGSGDADVLNTLFKRYTVSYVSDTVFRTCSVGSSSTDTKNIARLLKLTLVGWNKIRVGRYI